jgi:hypothetical protein
MTDEERVRELLGAAFAVDPPRGVAVTETVIRTRHRRRRAVYAVATVSAVVLVVGGAAAGAQLVGSSTRSNGQPADGQSARPAPTPSLMPSQEAVAEAVAAGPILKAGDLAEASGRVVQVPGRALRFCGPEEFDAVAWAPGHEPPPRWCPLGVDVEGVDLAKLSDYRTKAGATEGFAYLRGTWSGGTLHVSMQTAPRYPVEPTLNVNPSGCREPGSGWPVAKNPNPPQSVMDRIHAFEADHPDQVVTQAVARPNAHSNYMVVTVEDIGVAAPVLKPIPGELCLIKAKYSRSEVDQTRAPFEADLKAHLTDGHGVVATIGESVSEQGQPFLRAQVLMITEQVRHWAASTSPGLIKVTPWLRVISAGVPPPSLPVTPTGVDTFSTAPASQPPTSSG